jgi:hypothetical protein
MAQFNLASALWDEFVWKKEKKFKTFFPIECEIREKYVFSRAKLSNNSRERIRRRKRVIFSLPLSLATLPSLWEGVKHGTRESRRRRRRKSNFATWTPPNFFHSRLHAAPGGRERIREEGVSHCQAKDRLKRQARTARPTHAAADVKRRDELKRSN